MASTGRWWCRCRAAAALLCLAATLTGADEIETITVVATTPTGDSDVDVRDLPGSVQTVSEEQLARSGNLDISGYLVRHARGVHGNSAQGNPLQSDLYYRGYAASPLLGLPIGVTVYQDGVRLNEPLGDAVNWDLIPTTAIAGLSLVGGCNPLYGLNTLGGSVALQMKDGFRQQGHSVAVKGGSHGGFAGSLESGANNGAYAYYLNLSRFREDGWRDLSPSESAVFYGNFGWRGDAGAFRVDHQRATSDLTGNGLAPVGLLASDRTAIFTAPDITENHAQLWRVSGSATLAANTTVAANVHARVNDTTSFNGDGMEEDDIDELVESFGGRSAFAAALYGECRAIMEDDLDAGGVDLFTADDEEFEVAAAESGCGAVNNMSERAQESLGGVVEVHFDRARHDFRAGVGYYRGNSGFDSRIRFALLDPITRSTVTAGAVTGGFGGEPTRIDAQVARRYGYLGDRISLGESWIVTLSGYFHDSEVDLRDLTGEQSQLNGNHGFSNFNWGAGVIRRSARLDIFVSYSQSSRLPTPIELACSEALARDPDTGESEECRLPNAFLADPPLAEVVASGFEIGARGDSATDWLWSAVAFHTYNDSDIIWQTGQTRSHGLFRNVEGTRRKGVEANLTRNRGAWRWRLDYTHIVATFDDDFDVLSPNHPASTASEDDDTDEGAATRPVERGDLIPGIPRHVFKAGLDYFFTDRLSVGMDVMAVSGSHLRGDESNELDQLAGFVVTNGQVNYLNGRFEAFLLIENLLDTDYENFGLLGEEPNEVVGLHHIGDDVRFLAPGAPRSVRVGVKILF